MAKALQIARNDADELFVPRIRRLVEEGRIHQARELAKEAVRANPSEPGLAHWNEVLSPAVVRAVPGLDKDRSADLHWLQEHGDSYMDQWVAVLDGSLVAHAPTLRELQSILDEKAPGAPVLLHRFD